MENSEGEKKTSSAFQKLRPFVKSLVIRIVVFVVILIFLVQLTISLGQFLFVNRVGDSSVVALRCTFKPVPFDYENVTVAFNGEQLLVLNVTLNEQNLSLYSSDSLLTNMGDVGVIEWDNRTCLSLWHSSTVLSTDYVIDGNFSSLYVFGTTKPVAAMIIESYHDPSLLDDFGQTNRFYLVQIMLALVAVDLSCIAGFVWNILFLVDGALE